jgi:hypothetical protein
VSTDMHRALSSQTMAGVSMYTDYLIRTPEIELNDFVGKGACPHFSHWTCYLFQIKHILIM